MHAILDLVASGAIRSMHLGRSYLILPSQLHRWSVVLVSCSILVLVGCFIAYAFAEKHQIESSWFYGKLQFSFVDHGYPELFGYVLELVACAVFLLYAWLSHKKCWYMWALILLVIFFDDAFKMHEAIGHGVSAALGVSPVVGDLLGFASTGLLSAAFWLAGVRMITEQNDICAYFVFTVYFAVLIFFGVGVDALHGLLGANISQTAFTLVEDGGELFMIALIALSALGMLLRYQHAAGVDLISTDPALLRH